MPARDILRLTLVPGLGPVRIARLVEAFGDAAAVLGASHAQLARVKGIGDLTARRILEGLKDADARVNAELDKIDRAGARLVALGEPDYPALLAQVPGAPPILTVRGDLKPDREDRYTLAIVGSRRCTAYGLEQAERFAGILASQGLTIVSGGARGIDAAAHRAALRAGGRTIVVLGCGLAQCYPPEHKELFDRIASEGGAILSELPMDAPPDAQNFPARNRIISGLSLGILVIEAAEGSGALITARHALEDHAREVLAVPGRVDSEASRGSNALLRAGGAGIALDPADVLDALAPAARHRFEGTHAALTADPTRPPTGHPHPALFNPPDTDQPAAAHPPTDPNSPAARILAALDIPRDTDDLITATGLDPSAIRAELTMLEIAKRIRRVGPRFQRA